MILFVCTGNTCRSVMAEALMRLLWAERGGDQKIDFASAGLAPTDLRATEHVRQLLAREGVSLDSHVPRPLTRSMVDEASLILTMEEHHRRTILDFYPESAGKVFLLKEYAGIDEGAPGISDPYGGSREIYSLTLEEIRESIKKIVDKLIGTGD